MRRPLDHDEHQFIASAVLLARNLQLPYKDYPYFHMPNLVLAYAMLFKFTDHLLLGARIFSVVCSSMTLVLIFSIVCNLFPRHGYFTRFLISAGSVIVLLMNPLFAHTSGLAWNHDLAVLFILAAFAIYCYCRKAGRTKNWLFFSGLLLGAAMGTRLSIAPGIIAFVIMIVAYPNWRMNREKWYVVLAFSLGIFVSLLPSLFVFGYTPKAFVFGNIDYPQLNTMYREAMGYQRAMTVWGKLVYIKWMMSHPGNLIVLISFILVFLWRAPITPNGREADDFGFWFLLILVPFLLLGSIAPTPLWAQYFYAPIPFLVIGILYGVATCGDEGEKVRWSLRLFATAVIVCSIYGVSNYRYLSTPRSADEWIATEVHEVGIEIKREVVEGRVLTLAPIFPLEGGAEIYKEFATGPFAWRTAAFVREKDRRELGLISEDDLEEFLQKDPPRAILVGFERDLEKPLVKYARGRGYKALKLSNGKILWLSSSGIPGG